MQWLRFQGAHWFQKRIYMQGLNRALYKVSFTTSETRTTRRYLAVCTPFRDQKETYFNT